MKKFEKLFWAGVGYLILSALILLMIVVTLLSKQCSSPEKIQVQQEQVYRVDTVIKIVEKEVTKPQKKAKVIVPTVKDTIFVQTDTISILNDKK
jgi:Na+-transporting methylmalonyl-CoA/oxaloacetate decarboxylase gamma subunit